MGLVLIDPAVAWPVALDEAKAHCFATDTSDFDTLLQRLIKAATAHIERVTGRTLAVQGWRLVLDRFAAEIELPGGPVTTIDSFVYDDAAGAEQTVDESLYVLDLASNPQRIVLARGESWPDVSGEVGAVRIEFTAGYAANAPEDLRQAILMLVAHWFANREAVNVGNITSELPLGIRALIGPHRRMVL